jgi:predicted phage terminase large subunit-like protein
MSLLNFYEQKRPRSYMTNWHHRWICEVLERAYVERKNVILELPPRHGKSEIANVYGPSWRLESKFNSMFGLVTNSDNLAKKFSSACRNLCGLPLEVERDAQWKVRGLDSLNYSYMGAGIRGNITGHGFDTVIFDDLLKSGLEAKSDTVRETVWENVASAAINRLTPDGIVVALQARLHQQDTIGKLLELDHLKFLHLHLPATNDSGTEAWFRDGYSGEEIAFPAYAALWPQRYSRAKLDEIRSTVSSYYWNAQYMQVPSMGDLAYFDMERCPTYTDSMVERVWLAVDAANTETKSGSYSAFVCVGISDRSLKVLGVRRGRWRQDKIATELTDFYHTIRRTVGIFPEAVIVERAAAGYGLIDHLSGQLPIIPLIPKGSKEERAAAVCYLVNRGQVALPQSAPWLQPFREEMGNFPLSSFKDQVDAFVHGLSYALRPSEFQPIQQIVEYDAAVDLQLGGSFRGLDEVDLLDQQWNRKGNW